MHILKLTHGDGGPIWLDISKVETIRRYQAGTYNGSKINFRQDDAPVYVRDKPEDIFQALENYRLAMLLKQEMQNEREPIHGGEPVTHQG